MLCALYRKKGRNNRSSGLWCNRKLHEPHLCKMVAITNQTTNGTKTIIQRGRNGKQSRRTTLLHRPTGSNRKNHYSSTILPSRPRGTQGNLRICLVRSSTAKNRLETRMDRPHTTPHNSTGGKCE